MRDIDRIPMLASITIFTGYFCLAMTYQGYFPNSFLLCVFYLLLTGIASCAAHLSSMGTIVSNLYLIKLFYHFKLNIYLILVCEYKIVSWNSIWCINGFIWFNSIYIFSN